MLPSRCRTGTSSNNPSPGSRSISASPGSRRVSPAGNGVAPFAPGGTLRRRCSPQHPRDAGACTARDVREPRSWALTAHPSPDNSPPRPTWTPRVAWISYPFYPSPGQPSAIPHRQLACSGYNASGRTCGPSSPGPTAMRTNGGGRLARTAAEPDRGSQLSSRFRGGFIVLH